MVQLYQKSEHKWNIANDTLESHHVTSLSYSVFIQSCLNLVIFFTIVVR